MRFAHDARHVSAWNPADGPGPAPEQSIPAPSPIHPDGTTERGTSALWAPSQGPVRPETGGAGGEPEGHSSPIRKVCWD